MLAWAVWFGLCFLGFVALEARALVYDMPTLTAAIWALSRQYPLVPLIVGGVIVHLFDHPWGCKL